MPDRQEEQYKGPVVPSSEVYKKTKRAININFWKRVVKGAHEKLDGEETNPETNAGRRVISRRDLIKLGFTLVGYSAIGAIGYEALTLTHAWDRLTRAPWREYRSNLEEGEVLQLSLIDEHTEDPKNNGMAVFAREIAKEASIYDPAIPKGVVFTDVNTWGKSGLKVLLESTDKMLTDLSSTSGRDGLRNLSERKGGSLQTYYLGNIKKYEDYVVKNELPLNASQEQVIRFMYDNKEHGGLGYKEEDARLVLELLRDYKTNKITDELKRKINAINERSGSTLRIP